MTEWDAAPLTRSGPKGGLRRDPTQLPAGFLDRLWQETPEEAGCTPTRLRELEDWYATRFPQVWPDTTAMDEAVCRT